MESTEEWETMDATRNAVADRDSLPKSALVDIFCRLPLNISRPLATVIRHVWPGFRVS